jgi:hypothetical protein
MVSLFFLSFFCVCVCGVVEEEDRSNKKGREMKRKATQGATERGESLAVQPLQINNGSRGLLPLP